MSASRLSSFVNLDAHLPLHFSQQGHVMGDAHRHVGLLGLLLDETPLDAEVLVGEHARSC